MSIQGLPKIVRFTGTTDTGPDSGASCPHCGATGRYIHHFQTEDGRHGSAMSGCLKLFPVSKVALEEKRLSEKRDEYKSRGWNLNAADSMAATAIEEFYLGQRDERSVLAVVSTAKRSNQMRFRGRR